MTTEENRHRLCLVIIMLSVLMQLAAVYVGEYMPSSLEESDSTFERPRPNLSDWPVHGE